MLLGQYCSWLSTKLFIIITPDCGLIQAQQNCLMLLIAKNNVIPTTLLYPVFNKLQKLIIFGRLLQALKQTLLALINSINNTEVVSPERKPPVFTRKLYTRLFWPGKALLQLPWQVN